MPVEVPVPRDRPASHVAEPEGLHRQTLAKVGAGAQRSLPLRRRIDDRESAGLVAQPVFLPVNLAENCGFKVGHKAVFKRTRPQARQNMRTERIDLRTLGPDRRDKQTDQYELEADSHS